PDQQPAEAAANGRQHQREQAPACILYKRGDEAIHHQQQQTAEHDAHQMESAEQRTRQGRVGFGDQAAYDLSRYDVGQEEQTRALMRLGGVKQAEIPAPLRPQPHLTEVGIAIIRAEQKAAETGVLRKADEIGQRDDQQQQCRVDQHAHPFAPGDSGSVSGLNQNVCSPAVLSIMAGVGDQGDTCCGEGRIRTTFYSGRYLSSPTHSASSLASMMSSSESITSPTGLVL